MALRRRLRAAEQRSLEAALEQAGREVAPQLAELHRIAREKVLPAVPPDAHDEAMRAWINYILGTLLYSSELDKRQSL